MSFQRTLVLGVLLSVQEQHQLRGGDTRPWHSLEAKWALRLPIQMTFDMRMENSSLWTTIVRFSSHTV
jgi:hypothetical protein